MEGRRLFRCLLRSLLLATLCCQVYTTIQEDLEGVEDSMNVALQAIQVSTLSAKSQCPVFPECDSSKGRKKKKFKKNSKDGCIQTSLKRLEKGIKKLLKKVVRIQVQANSICPEPTCHDKLDPVSGTTTCTCGKVYKECGTACPRTCKDVIENTSRPCTRNCVRGCFCREGTVLNDSGYCVSEDQCLRHQKKFK